MHTQRSLLAVCCAAHLSIALIGCEGANKPSPQEVSAGMEQAATDIEFLYFDGCPNSPTMRSRLDAAIAKLAHPLNVVDVDLMATSDTDLRRGYGAPTVLVNGVDLFGRMPPSNPGLTCRVYEEGIPTEAAIGSRLLLAVGP